MSTVTRMDASFKSTGKKHNLMATCAIYFLLCNSFTLSLQVKIGHAWQIVQP